MTGRFDVNRPEMAAYLDELRADKARRTADPRPPAPVEFSPELVRVGMAHHRRIGRLGDSKRLQNYYERATREAVAHKESSMSNNVANLPAVQPAADRHALMEQVFIHGDLSKLSSKQRTDYYMETCSSLGLNPLTRPFDYIRLNGKEVLYAKRDCTDQLRSIRHISLEVVSETISDGLLLVRVKATTPDGRSDSDIGAVPVIYPNSSKDRNNNWVQHPKAGQRMTGEDLANAMMKATTKAKRRVTLSLCGLGFMDETEVASVLEAEAQLAAPVADPAKTLALVLPDGQIKRFPKTKKAEGIPALLDYVELEVRHEGPAILLEPDNIKLLDNIAGMDCFARRVADIRAAGNKALLPPADDLTDEALGIPDFDPETGEVYEPDSDDLRRAERRGAVPADIDPDQLPA